MKLSDVLRPEHVVVPLQARSVREATEQLAERLAAGGAVRDPARLREVIRAAWPEDMTAVGAHAFLPHFRTDAAERLAVALGVSPAPIRWEKDPQRSARIVILIVAPPKDAPTYLQTVGAFARALADPDTVQAIERARTPADVALVAALEQAELTGHLTVRDVMTPNPQTIGPDRTLGEAATFMLEHDIRALPVVNEGGGLVGMITHRELLKYLLPEYQQRAKTGAFRAPSKAQIARGTADPRAMPVRDAMARSVLCVSEDQTLSDVANLMGVKDVDRFPVVREGVVVGFLTRADLIRRLITP